MNKLPSTTPAPPPRLELPLRALQRGQRRICKASLPRTLEASNAFGRPVSNGFTADGGASRPQRGHLAEST